MGFYVFVTAVGYVGAGICASLVDIAYGKKSFWRPHPSPLHALGAFGSFAIIGPYWMARNAAGCLNQETPLWQLAGVGFLISLVWAFCGGVLMVQLLELLALI